MVRSGWSRHARLTVAAAAALFHGLQAGCLFPSYSFNEPEPGAAGGATSTATGTSSAGGAPSTSSAVSVGIGGAASVTASASASASSSDAASTSASSSSTGGGVVIAPGDLIDDMEAGSGNILQQGGRIGSWYTYNDGTVGATQTPMAGGPFLPDTIPGGHGASTAAAHTAGTGFTLWGSGMGFDLHNDGTTKQAYSVAGSTGIAFWAKGSPGSIRFKVLIQTTVAVAEGGTCTVNCGDSHGALIALGAAWQQYAIPFASLKQQNWGTPAAWDPTLALSIQYQAGVGAEDFWIDDIGLY